MITALHVSSTKIAIEIFYHINVMNGNLGQRFILFYKFLGRKEIDRITCIYLTLMNYKFQTEEVLL